MKRLALNGKVRVLERSRDETNVYTDVDFKGKMIDHGLKIVDCYFAFKMPKVYDVEVKFGCYEPDVVTVDKNGNKMCLEIQVTDLSLKKMQDKFNRFYKEKDKHGCKVFVIISDKEYKVEVPNGFYVKRFPIPMEYRLG